MSSFATVEDLAEWLHKGGVDIDAWGRGHAKSLVDLWVEYQQGDITLKGPPPLRLVRVAEVLIERDGRLLVEVAQEFADGRRRARFLPPSEKVKIGEPIFSAVARCLCEELGLSANEFTLGEASPPRARPLVESPSYPGLATRYIVVSVPATVAGLPAEPFWRANSAAAAGDPVVRQQWAWHELG
jgi:hypothetical protein